MTSESVFEIDAFGRHGEGVARTADGPVYLPGALPGETVRATVEGERGTVTEILRRSPDRIDPFCPHYDRCGGCSAQHWREAPYRAWKRDLVVIALAHRHIEAPVGELVDAHGAGRRRVSLHLRYAGGRTLAGFMEAGSHRLLDLDSCPILVPALRDAPRIARLLGSPFASHAKSLDIAVTATESGLDCNVRAPRNPPRQIEVALAEIAMREDLARVTINGETVIERRPPRIRAGSVPIVPPPGGFLQATAAGEAFLAQLIVDAVGAAPRVADLFCGVGPFALRLAGSASVLAIDSDARAIAALTRAAHHATGLKPVQAVTRDLYRRPLTATDLEPFDAIVFDPPRAGAETQTRAIAQARARTVVAVSCDPATFARDAAILLAGGYALVGVTPVDQFKWSAHVEIAGLFRRQG